MDDIATQRNLYDRIHFTDRIGFGARPAILVIDMNRGITERSYPMFIDMGRAMEHMNDMFAIARRKGVPVIYTSTVFTPPHFADGGTFIKKVPLVRGFVEGSPSIDVDPRIEPAPGEIVIKKHFPSGFYATNMQSLLTYLQIDTTIVTGNSTSGCVRATVVDACSGGFRVIVPRECVADRVKLSHDVALFDMDAKYGDVVPVSDVLSYLEGLPANAGTVRQTAQAAR